MGYWKYDTTSILSQLEGMQLSDYAIRSHDYLGTSTSVNLIKRGTNIQ
jgi:hypothetical protein